MIQSIRDLAQRCFHLYYSACVTMRAQGQMPSLEALQSRSLELLQNNMLDARSQRVFQNLLQTGTEIYLHFALQGKVFVGIDDGVAVLCLACAGTLQGSDAITDVVAWCWRYAVCDTDPVAGYLNCEICNEPLIDPEL
ncbi:MAG: hypothetical protein H0U76_22135 [Ktedonobacteraceae bacterium]|nr:hypothetical protein [Ktedonobacteraceae bacterium]